MFAVAAFVVAVLAGSNLLHEMMIPLGTATRYPPKLWAMIIQTVAAAGVAAMSGPGADGHAPRPRVPHGVEDDDRAVPAAELRRRGRCSSGRALLAIAATVAHDRATSGCATGCSSSTRWLVGLLVPAVFVYMAHDCIKRRSTQSATGILYVAGVLIFIGEIVALYLVRGDGIAVLIPVSMGSRRMSS